MSLRAGILSAALLLTCAATSAEAAPILVLAPASGTPTATARVTIAGFAPARFVDVYFDTTDECLIRTDGKGKGSCTFKVPATAQPETHWVSAVVRATGTGLQKPFVVRTPWTNPHGQTPASDGYNRFENTITPQNAGNLELVWTVIPTVQIRTTPVVAFGRIYVSTYDGKLYAFDATTGAKIAGFPKTTGLYSEFSSPVITGRSIFLTSYDITGTVGRIFGFDALTGAPIKGFPITLGGKVYGAMRAIGNRLYVGAWDGNIYGIDATNGHPLANFPVSVTGSPMIASTLAYAGGYLYFGDTSGGFHAIDATTGAERYSFATAGNFDISSPTVVRGTVYFSNFNEMKLRAVDALGGSTIWTPLALSGKVDSTPAVAGDGVYLGEEGGVLAKVRASTGSALWSTHLDQTNAPVAGPVVAGGVVFASTYFRTYAVDAASGAVLWQTAEGVITGQNPVVVNGMVYIAKPGGGLSAYALNGVADRPATAAPPNLSSLTPDLSLKPQ